MAKPEIRHIVGKKAVLSTGVGLNLGADGKEKAFVSGSSLVREKDPVGVTPCDISVDIEGVVISAIDARPLQASVMKFVIEENVHNLYLGSIKNGMGTAKPVSLHSNHKTNPQENTPELTVTFTGTNGKALGLATGVPENTYNAINEIVSEKHNFHLIIDAANKNPITLQDFTLLDYLSTTQLQDGQLLKYSGINKLTVKTDCTHVPTQPDHQMQPERIGIHEVNIGTSEKAATYQLSYTLPLGLNGQDSKSINPYIGNDTINFKHPESILRIDNVLASYGSPLPDEVGRYKIVTLHKPLDPGADGYGIVQLAQPPITIKGASLGTSEHTLKALQIFTPESVEVHVPVYAHVSGPENQISHIGDTSAFHDVA